MQTTGFGIVGCGRISERHFQSIAEVDAARLIAVCDKRVERAREKAEKYDVPWYASMEEMLEAHSNIDVASILTPSGNHAEQALGALRAGRHVLVEKPMALTLDDAEEMILTADTMNKRLFVVKQNRCNKPVISGRTFTTDDVVVGEPGSKRRVDIGRLGDTRRNRRIGSTGSEGPLDPVAGRPDRCIPAQ